MHPGSTLAQGWSRPETLLVLTKRLGTGLLVSGARQGRTDPGTWHQRIEQMQTLNRTAAEVLAGHEVRAATDITGFGLLGHGLEMARASGVRLVFEAATLPALDGALELARAGRRDRWRRTQSTLRRRAICQSAKGSPERS